jgi:Holliday junction resolvasome RuvABC endonuclease subunit
MTEFLRPHHQKTILGLDLGTYSSGYSLLSFSDPVKLLRWGKFGAVNEDYMSRWGQAILKLDLVLQDLENHDLFPVAVAVEEPNYSRNMESVRQLCGLFGAICHRLLEHWKVFPTQVNTAHAKKVFCGKGGGDKIVTINRCNSLFGLNLKFVKPSGTKHIIGESDDDVADAIQAAYTVRRELLELENSPFKD